MGLLEMAARLKKRPARARSALASSPQRRRRVVRPLA
jgi:hypothetical protein|tara:strand:+ start:444 stop:554 length:111 start_codon:yes stop_codon:yes gene_type:complete